MPSRRHGSVPILFFLAIALGFWGVAAAPGQTEFIPAPDEPCGIRCPDPEAPLSRANYPPRDDNFSRMFVPSESGLALVPNPHWNGEESTLDQWCGVQCPNPYAPLSPANMPRRNDATAWMWVVRSASAMALVRNPNWVVAAQLEAVLSSAPLPALEASTGEADGEFDEIVLDSLDRTGSVYHPVGDDVLQRKVLQSIGGVLSQGGTVPVLRGQQPTSVEFMLGPDGAYPGYVGVSDGAWIGRYRIRYTDLVPMALFVDSGGTSLYTLWEEDKLPANFPSEAGFARHARGPGFVALEFAGTRYADALRFLDTCVGCVRVPDDEQAAASNAGAMFDAAASGGRRSSSYINTDVGSLFGLQDMDGDLVTVTGGIVRIHWSGETRTGREISIDARQPVVGVRELRANVDRSIEDVLRDRVIEAKHMLLLMRGQDLLRDIREEANLRGRRRLADAFCLFETLALLRSTKFHVPDAWSAFMVALSLDWIVARNREPWERYSETFCNVYPESRECGERTVGKGLAPAK